MTDKEKTIREHLQTLTKDCVIELCLQYIFDKNVVETQLEEKYKEIESLKQQLEETNAGYDFTYEQSTEAIKELKQNQTQLAIQELEKMEDFAFNYVLQQIKELSGGKNGKF